MLNVCAILEINAREHPGKTAVRHGNQALTFSELDAAAARVAGVLSEAGILPGQNVAISCLTGAWFPIVYYGVLKLGAAVVPLNPQLKPRDIAYCLGQSESVAYLCGDGNEHLPLLDMGKTAYDEVPTCKYFWRIPDGERAAAPETQPDLHTAMQAQPPRFESYQPQGDDLSTIIYTSGTTGRPKGAALSHTNILMNSLMVRQALDYRATDELLIAVPMFHSMGQVVLMNAGFVAGAGLVFQTRFDPVEVLQAFQDLGITFFCGVPTMYAAILNHPRIAQFDVTAIAQRLRLTCCGGAPVPQKLIDDFFARFDTPIVIGYGLSETSPIITMTRPQEPHQPCSVGKTLWGIEVAIADAHGHHLPRGQEGEILVRGHNVMRGYYNNPEATAAAFWSNWFRTGDVGRQDAEGNLFVLDRCKDMIIRGGCNVYPIEVEQVMLRHPALESVAVIGVPHDLLGEEVKAVAVLKPEAELTEAALRAWCKEEIAGHAYPRVIEFRDALPLGPTGKILKRVLREKSTPSESAKP
jgi:long-chain acyl-CoA synthetase